MGFIGGRLKKVCGRSQELRSMPLCLANGAFKPLKGPFHGKRLRGESKVDRSRSEGERRQKRFDSSVTGTRGEQEFSRVGMIYGAFGGIFGGEDPHVFPYLLLCVCPPPRNLPTSNRFPTTIFFTSATTDQINEEHARMLQTSNFSGTILEFLMSISSCRYQSSF